MSSHRITRRSPSRRSRSAGGAAAFASVARRAARRRQRRRSARPANDPRGPWRSDDHRPRRGGWRDHVLAPSQRALAPASVLQARAARRRDRRRPGRGAAGRRPHRES